MSRTSTAAYWRRRAAIVRKHRPPIRFAGGAFVRQTVSAVSTGRRRLSITSADASSVRRQ
ncbi:hypothetical protein RJ641_001657 [Dillenia turbinata]|uniref:Uncharacterized protein n=1 Tax=Dillenia turbinata TaxID=194707 RepID=A0AAN8VBN5_9MAGN